VCGFKLVILPFKRFGNGKFHFQIFFPTYTVLGTGLRTFAQLFLKWS